jgi:carbamoyl-phosphate synthase large subunit
MPIPVGSAIELRVEVSDLSGLAGEGGLEPVRSNVSKSRKINTLRTSTSRTVSILFTCIGRRVSLINAFRDAAGRLKMPIRIVGADASLLSPALHLCDEKVLVPAVRHTGYLKSLLKIVRKYGVRLLIPTVDLDLKILSENRETFARLGCRVLVSDPNVIAICQDKRKTFRFLRQQGFDTPETMTIASALQSNKIGYPCFLKPWDGYASRGNAVARNRKELAFYGRRIPNCIVQEFIAGDEFTCDAFVDDDLRVRCVVPRRRLEVRSGEVSKARIHKDPEIMELVARLVTALGAGPGVITIQLIRPKDGGIRIIEVNPRFGGGAPLSIRAGADFPLWVLQELCGTKPRIGFDGFENGLVMLRYDHEVWLREMGRKP